MPRHTLLTFLAMLAFSTATIAAKPEVYSPPFGDAIRGFDPVAYFTESKPIKGNEEHTIEYKDATWRFASAANKQAFKQMPEKYAPQYGGYCAYAVSQGYTASIDPEAWSIVDGKLYLNYSKSVQDKWSKDIPGYIRKADNNWPKVLK